MNKKTNWPKNVKHVGPVIILLLLLTLLPSRSVYAATITVNSMADNITADDDLCTLREAINNANSDSDTTNSDCVAGSGADTINLPAGTYTLASGVNDDDNLGGDLDITDGDGLTITGADARTTIIQAGTTSSNALDRVLHIIGFGVPLTIEQVTIRHGHHNGVAGGILNEGVLTINNSTITQNSTYGGSRDGGAIRNLDTLIINDSTLSYNTAARSGGAIHQQGGSITINNSTISNNTASDVAQGVGGGIYVNAGTVTINNSTIASNDASSNSGTGGGININSGTVNIKNTIIADNTASSNPDCNGTLTSDDYNLIEDTTGCTINGTTTNNITGTDPMLDGLANNGGPTDTHELQSGSPAINTGESPTCTVSTDQRGGSRPQGSGCDIGAYEVGALVVDLASFSATNEGYHLRVEWATVWESNNLGFNLYRNTSAEFSEAERLNPTLIPAGAPGSGSGFAYEYDDNDVLLGTTYHYWLGDMDLGGHETLHGPVSIDYNTIPTSVSMSGFESHKPFNFSWLVILTVLAMTIGVISIVFRIPYFVFRIS